MKKYMVYESTLRSPMDGKPRRVHFFSDYTLGSKELKDQGYEFVSIGELIYKQDYHMLADGTQIKNN